MASDAAPKERWFVEVKSQPTGPFFTGEIIRDLLQAKIKVTQRVSRDRQNWKAICNEPRLENAIQALLEDISKEMTKYAPDTKKGSTDDVQTGFHNVGSISQGISEQLQQANELVEMSAGIAGLRKLLAEISAKKKLVIEYKPREEEELHPDDRNEYIAPPGGLWHRWKSLDARLKRRVLISAGSLILVLTLVMGYLNYQARAEAQRVATQMRLALEAKRLGDYERAVQLFRGIEDTSNLEPGVLLEIAQAHIAQKNLGEGQQMLRQFLLTGPNRSDSAKAHALLGLIASKENDMTLAIKSYEEALRDENIFSVMHNLAIAYISRTEYEKAEELLLKAITLADQDKAVTALALFEVAWMLDERDATVATANKTTVAPADHYRRLKHVTAILNDLLMQPQFFARELLVAQTIASHKAGDDEGARKSVNRFLDVDDKALPARVPRADLDDQRAGWNYVFSWCRDLYKQNQKNDRITAFFAGCVLKNSGAASALPYVQYAHQMNTTDPWINGLLAHALWSAKNLEEAKQVLQRMNNSARASSRLARVTVAEVCRLQPTFNICAQQGP